MCLSGLFTCVASFVSEMKYSYRYRYICRYRYGYRYYRYCVIWAVYECC